MGEATDPVFDPAIDLYDPAGNHVAGNYVYGIGTSIQAKLTVGGTYTLVASDHNGDNTGNYSLTLTTTTSDDPDDQISEAKSLGGVTTIATSTAGAITVPTDVDMYSFTVAGGQRISFDIDTATNGAPGLGSYLRVFGVSGTELAFNNDAKAPDESTVGFDSYVEYTFASAGTYFVGVSSWQNSAYNATTGSGDFITSLWGTGSYTLILKSLTALKPTVTITATDGVASEQASDTATFKVMRSDSTSASLTVKYTIGGTATNGTDYNTLSGSVIIAAGASSATVTLTPKDDGSYEGKEIAVLSLQSNIGYTVGSPSSATATLNDNDPAI